MTSVEAKQEGWLTIPLQSRPRISNSRVVALPIGTRGFAISLHKAQKGNVALLKSEV